MLSEILSLKIGDLTDRILDEVVHDLTPYGYKPLSEDSVDVTCANEIDNKNKYVRIGNDSHNDDVAVSNTYVANVVYSHDVIADIMLNGHTDVATELTTEVCKQLPKDIVREIAGNTMTMSRRVSLLKRKTITRAYKKIIRIITENKVDMTIKEDTPIDMSIKEDEIKDFIRSVK